MEIMACFWLFFQAVLIGKKYVKILEKQHKISYKKLILWCEHSHNQLNNK